ncbi:hypothetical protein ABZ942_11130 [Nocardia sp. NPDC046473]
MEYRQVTSISRTVRGTGGLSGCYLFVNHDLAVVHRVAVPRA